MKLPARLLVLAQWMLLQTAGHAFAADLRPENIPAAEDILPGGPGDPLASMCDGDVVPLAHQVEVIGYDTGMTSGVAADDGHDDYGVFLFIEQSWDPETEEPRWVYQIYGLAGQAVCELAEDVPGGQLIDLIGQCVGALVSSERDLTEPPPDCVGIP